jgi:hypothetical protein
MKCRQTIQQLRGDFDMKPGFLRTVLLSVIAAAGALPAVAQVSGSIQTTLPTGATLQGSRYPSKTQVFFTAGPQNQKASGLPDGRYYFQVTDPSGSTLLSTDPAACRQVVVSGGRLAGAWDPVKQALEPAGSPLDTANCEHASVAPTANSASGAAAMQVGGAVRACSIDASGPDILCNTPNPGGEYKLWLIAQSSAVGKCNTTVNPDGFTLNFDRSCAKTDNFTTELPAVSHTAACAFNDTNGNGVLDPGELMISGWPITATVPAASYVTLRSDNQSGTSVTANTDSTGCVSFAALGIPTNTQVSVTLTEANLTRWTQTAPGNGTYDASGKPAQTGPGSVSGAVPVTGHPASGGTIAVNLGPGATVKAPDFASTNPQCPDCSILGTVTVLNSPTPQKLYTWGITKTVDKTQIDVAPGGGSALFNYTVSVTHDSGAGALLTGTITLINADSSTPSVTLNVVDAVSDGGACKIQDPATGQYVPELFNLTLNSFTQTTLPYQCTYNGSAPSVGTNIVTATNLSNNPAQYTSAASYDFSTATAIADQTVTVMDSLKGALGTVSYTDASPRTFQYSLTFSSDPAGTCSSHNNIATLTAGATGMTASASQNVKVCISKTTPTIATTPNPTAVTLGGSSVTLRDSAVLSGGVNPSGTITFTLFLAGTQVHSEAVAVNGNGTYTTTGYTLPTSGTVAGTYQWNASYSGDANNSAVNENNNPSEQVAVSKVLPDLTVELVTRGGSGVLSRIPIAVNATLSGGYNPTGTITFTRHNYTERTDVCSVVLPVNGSATYSTSGCPGNKGDQYYGYVVSYSGDDKNSPKQAFSSSWYSPN